MMMDGPTEEVVSAYEAFRSDGVGARRNRPQA
jgi:hypothetical protein